MTNLKTTGTTTKNNRGQTPDSKFERLCSFGDSFSDNGYSDGYGFRRYSESLVWVEFLARKLGIPLTNYAHAGAKTGDGNFNHPRGRNEWSGLCWQVREYLKSPPADPACSLFTVLCSLNDILSGERDPTRPVKNIKSAITRLAEAGGRYFIYREHSLALKSPGFNNPEYSRYYQPALEMLAAINNITRRELPSLAENFSDLKLIYLSNETIFQKISDGAEGYIFAELNRPWLGTYTYPKPYDFAWYDEWHPSGQVHQLLADETYEAMIS